MENVMYQIASLTLTILGLIITYFVVPWLKTKFSNEKLTTVEMWVNIAVAAAEQMKAAGILTVPKKDYVLAFIKDKGITITDKELDALIEAAVYELNRAKNLLFEDLANKEVEPG
ncbi:Bacteriophage holin of superfamily 6 [anaerobic digester metagenome]